MRYGGGGIKRKLFLSNFEIITAKIRNTGERALLRHLNALLITGKQARTGVNIMAQEMSD
jgi:hypothetical protein